MPPVMLLPPACHGLFLPCNVCLPRLLPCHPKCTLSPLTVAVGYFVSATREKEPRQHVINCGHSTEKGASRRFQRKEGCPSASGPLLILSSKLAGDTSISVATEMVGLTRGGWSYCARGSPLGPVPCGLLNSLTAPFPHSSVPLHWALLLLIVGNTLSNRQDKLSQTLFIAQTLSISPLYLASQLILFKGTVSRPWQQVQI